jgi:hypothetical protein
MATLCRCGLLAALACVLLCGGLTVARSLFGCGCSPADVVELCRLQERDRKLDRANRAAQERYARKRDVLADVLARRLTLLQAAGAFRRIHEETWEEFNCFDEKQVEDRSDRAMCRLVIAWVRSELLDTHGDTSLLWELEAEFVRMFGQPSSPDRTPPTRPPSQAQERSAT